MKLEKATSRDWKLPSFRERIIQMYWRWSV